MKEALAARSTCDGSLIIAALMPKAKNINLQNVKVLTSKIKNCRFLYYYTLYALMEPMVEIMNLM